MTCIRQWKTHNRTQQMTLLVLILDIISISHFFYRSWMELSGNSLYRREKPNPHAQHDEDCSIIIVSRARALKGQKIWRADHPIPCLKHLILLSHWHYRIVAGPSNAGPRAFDQHLGMFTLPAVAGLTSHWEACGCIFPFLSYVIVSSTSSLSSCGVNNEHGHGHRRQWAENRRFCFTILSLLRRLRAQRRLKDATKGEGICG